MRRTTGSLWTGIALLKSIQPFLPVLPVVYPWSRRPGHGYCATDNWIRTAAESEIIQGPVNFRKDTKGLLHPTVHGHQVIKDRILYYMLPDLVPEQQQDPPQIVFSFASDGLTDIRARTAGISAAATAATPTTDSRSSGLCHQHGRDERGDPAGEWRLRLRCEWCDLCDHA